MNIIVTNTPIVSTLEVQPAYVPLAKHGVNIFTFKFSGTGKSGGREKNFSLTSIVNDLDAVVQYVEKRFSSNIHLYGNTGIGGMFAQYCVYSTNKIKSFAQFACVDFKNAAGVGYSYPDVKVMSSLLTLLPNFHITVKPPKYVGYNDRKDNSFYEMLARSNPNMFKNSTKIMNTLLECFVSPDSAVKNGVAIPTLVFKTLHDRYFSAKYFDSYFSSLTCKKKLIEIDDIHNSYYFRSEEFCKAVYEWFTEN